MAEKDMFDKLAGRVLSICNGKIYDYPTADHKLNEIKRAVKEMVIEAEKEAKISKSLKMRIKAIESFFKEIRKDNWSNKFKCGSKFPKSILTDDNSDFSDGTVAYFGSPFCVFQFERNCELFRNLGDDYFENGNNIEFGRAEELLNKVLSPTRVFKTTIEYYETVAAKKMSESKVFCSIEKEISNIYDEKDIIHRQFNGITLQPIFKILGLDLLEVFMTDDYHDSCLIKGYDEYVGNYNVVTSFLNIDGAIKKYAEETEKRRKKIKAMEEELSSIREKTIEKGKNGKLKFKKLVNPNMPADEDLPF